jgi:hypothetical protein
MRVAHASLWRCVVVSLLVCSISVSPLYGAVTDARAMESSVVAGELKGEAFEKCIKFLGGPGFPDFKGHETWDNSLLIGDQEAVCAFGDETIPPVAFKVGNVKSILYGQASSRHAGVWVSVGVILAPVALLGLLHKGRKHNVLVSWLTDDGKEGGVYLQVQPDHVRRLLNTLAYRTGKPVYADEKDRKWLLTQGVDAKLDPNAK